jgi:hypothetical protein
MGLVSTYSLVYTASTVIGGVLPQMETYILFLMGQIEVKKYLYRCGFNLFFSLYNTGNAYIGGVLLLTEIFILFLMLQIEGKK